MGGTPMPNATTEEIKKLLMSTTFIRVTFRIDQPGDIPRDWTVRNRTPRPSRPPSLVLPRKSVAPLSELLSGRGYHLNHAGACTVYEAAQGLRKQRVTFFWSKGNTNKVNLEHTPDAPLRMRELCAKCLYNVEIYIDEARAVGFYCKPI